MKRIITITLLVMMAFCLCSCSSKTETEENLSKEELVVSSAINDFNSRVREYNTLSKEYNEVIKLVDLSCIDVEMQEIPELLEIKAEDIEIDDVVSEEVNEQTKEVLNFNNTLKNSIKVLSGLYKPSNDVVIDKLSKVQTIRECQAVSPENDVTGMINDKNKLQNCVYFSVSQINPDDLYGETVVDKGTAVGGAIEVYGSVEDAKERVEYLSQFDGTILDSGSYLLLGTMVIRTSYILEAEVQSEITAQIIEAFFDK